jgi:hypothetical protein
MPEPPGYDAIIAIIRRLDELERLVVEGFARLGVRLDQVERRVEALERGDLGA